MKDIIYRKSSRRRALYYGDWLFQKSQNVASVLDIGAADGKFSETVPTNVSYAGIDIGADIYSRESNVKYIEDYDKLKQEIRVHDAVDLTVMLDVLEHTPEFVELFELALNCSNKYSFVSLPNELAILGRWRVLTGHTVSCHGLEMLKRKPGHKHLWMIDVDNAVQVLSEVAEKNEWKLHTLVYMLPEPRKLVSKIAFCLPKLCLSEKLTSIGFGLLFEKK